MVSDEVLQADITALNRQFLNLIARHSEVGPDLCLMLNVSLDFLKAVVATPSGDLETVAALGTCLVQPLIDVDSFITATKLTPTEARAHIRSAARLRVLGR